MQVLFCSIVILTWASTSFAATAIGPATVRDSHPTMCYEKERNHFHNAGESWQLDNCGMATCMLTNYTGRPQLMVSYESCGSVDVDPPCYLSEETTASYPACCPQPICPDSAEEAENEIEDSEDELYSEAKEFLSHNYLSDDNENSVSEKQAETRDSVENGIQSGEGFLVVNPDQLKYEDLFEERKSRKVSPRFQFLDDVEMPDSYFGWF